jgi:hypothetical protein
MTLKKISTYLKGAADPKAVQNLIKSRDSFEKQFKQFDNFLNVKIFFEDTMDKGWKFSSPNTNIQIRESFQK